MDEYPKQIILFLTVSFSDKATQDYSSIRMLNCWPVIGNFNIICSFC
jgi:hypothetical protein